MFTTEDILKRLREKPFVPLRIIISSGEKFDVYHPDLVWVGHRQMMVGMASSENPAIYETATRVPLMHVTALEDLPVRTPGPEGNGR